MSKPLYMSLPKGQKAIIVYPNTIAMVFGIAQIMQDRRGNITALDAAGRIYPLGKVLSPTSNLSVDIQAEYKGEHENYLLSLIAPLCSQDISVTS
jgi:hypothetical protein